MRDKVWRLLLAVLLGTGASYSTGAAQGKVGLELLSKADAIRLFGLTKQQWLREIRAAVAAGQAKDMSADQQMPGMATQTADGDILTVRVDYSKTDSKPLFIQVVVGYRPPRAKMFTDSAVKDLIAEAQRQLEPEFEVTADAERIQGGLAFFFHISEKNR
jgi:hypothetical protein